MRVHGTTQARPAEVFAVEEQPRLLPAPTERLRPADLRDGEGPSRPSHRGRQGALLGAGQPDRPAASRCAPTASLVRIFARGQLVKVHPRQQPGGRSPTRTTCPSQQDRLRDARPRPAAAAWPPATATRSAPTPPRCWTSRCRGRRCARSTRCSGLVKKWGAARVEAACASALEHEAVNVGLIGRMLERGTEAHRHPAAAAGHRWSPGGSPATRPLRRRADRPHPSSADPSRPQSDPGARFAPMRRSGPMSAPTVTPELKALLRRVKLGRCLDTLPERLALARTGLDGPRRVPRARPRRRGHPPRDHLRRPACPRRRARPEHDPGPLGRHRQGHLRPRRLERAVLAALRRRPATTP